MFNLVLPIHHSMAGEIAGRSRSLLTTRILCCKIPNANRNGLGFLVGEKVLGICLMAQPSLVECLISVVLGQILRLHGTKDSLH